MRQPSHYTQGTAQPFRLIPMDGTDAHQLGGASLPPVRGTLRQELLPADQGATMTIILPFIAGMLFLAGAWLLITHFLGDK